MSRRSARGGTLHAIAGLLVLSGIVRIALAGEAIAENLPAPEPEQAAPVVAGDQPEDLILAFQRREARLQARETRLEERMRALTLAEREASERLEQLTEAEETLRAMLEQVDIAAETDVERLVAVYENMKPAEAAELFAQMPPTFAAGFMALLTPQTAGQIMALVPPDQAYSISVVLAGRNADLPDE
ncbi:hypothetical protein EU805_12915 [Salipiger sp. IMCC34102]|uniref:MotE family protein n=1 Tax=Salipiger sp. IMCC34102 TaxID=2510647 RepID=UPI00101BC6C2|nr:hypothetical protein [Salipiger sp. IMCC34102]RYH01558.1 hypothetical protein EU805_12915 [Salipiger sp. IMCC34102]